MSKSRTVKLPRETQVLGYLIVAERLSRQLRDIEWYLMGLLGEKEEGGHVGDFVWGGQTDARDLIRKVETRNKFMKGKP